MTTNEYAIVGCGIVSPIGQGKAAFQKALLGGEPNFGVLTRPGRQLPDADLDSGLMPFIGAELDKISFDDRIGKSHLRTASISHQAALVALAEAWDDADLDQVDSDRIGLVIGGSNLQVRHLREMTEQFRKRESFIRPTYGFSFLDSDIGGLCTEIFGIRGSAYTVGGASASGQLAVIKAMDDIESGRVDVAIALGALMDISYWECQSLRAIGAMGSEKFNAFPNLACRPFDRDRDGFIYGESCGALVITKNSHAVSKTVYGRIVASGLNMDANRNPNPSVEGEVRAIQTALANADLCASDIDYINPHATSSILGDDTELKALEHCRLNHAAINTTKSIVGHGLTASGIVEIVATLMQMQAGSLHPSLNLDNPIRDDFNWVLGKARPHCIRAALTLNMGFGGLNSALCLLR